MKLKAPHFDKLEHLLYQTLWYLAVVPLLIATAWRYRKEALYNNSAWQRFGFQSSPFYSQKQPSNPQANDQTKQNAKLWIHMASVGEAQAGLVLIKALLESYSLSDFLFTTQTPMGKKILQENLGSTIEHVYFPFDIPSAVKRFHQGHCVSHLILFETELWPIMIRECRRRNIPVLLVNARLSASSQSRYQGFSDLTKQSLQALSLIATQTPEEAQRFLQLGAKSTTVMGNLKLDKTIDVQMRSKATSFREQFSKRSKKTQQELDSKPQKNTICLAASVHPGEEIPILTSYLLVKKNFPDTVLLLAPRHLENCALFEAACHQQALTFIRKSKLQRQSIQSDVEVIIIDSIGEVNTLCGCTDVVIMGGTFIDHGGHNFLEPAAWGKPILSGTSDFNFATISKSLQQCGALTQVSKPQELANAWCELLTQDRLRLQKGLAGQTFVEQNHGALSKLLDTLGQLILLEHHHKTTEPAKNICSSLHSLMD